MDRPVRLVLVRHGRPRGGYGDDHDPGLDDVGLEQAAAMAAELASLGPLPVLVSPLRRTRETAAALEAAWGVRAVVEERVGEVPSPTDVLAQRSAWLRAVWGATWPDLSTELHDWRAALLGALGSIGRDAVVVTHYVAINTVVGAATGDQRLVCCAPDFCSRTVVDVADIQRDGDGLTLVELGAQAATGVR